MKNMKTDIVIIGCGVAGLYCALNLPEEKKIIVVTKDIAENSDTPLSYGGCRFARNTHNITLTLDA